jgi:hypothetical protein
MILNDTPAVIIGFKEEGDTTEIAATNESTVDVLGGLAYMVWNGTDTSKPLFSLDGGSKLIASFDEAVINSCCTVAYYLAQDIDQEYYTQAGAFQSRSDGGHVVGNLRTGPSVINPSAITVKTSSSNTVSGVSIMDYVAATHAGTMALNVNCSSGTITMKDQNGNLISGSGTGYISYVGTLAQENAALATLTYEASGSPGSDLLTINPWNEIGENTTQNIYIAVTR